MMAIKHRIVLLVLLAPVTIGLLFVGPSQLFGIDFGIAGGLAVGAAGWATLYGWSRVAGASDEHWSRSEVLAGIGFTFALAIAFVYFYKFRALGWDVDSFADSGRSIGRGVVMLLIAWIVFSGVVEYRRGALAVRDERDRTFLARAQAQSHHALVVVLVGLILQFGLAPDDFFSRITGPNVAHWLIGALIVSSVVEYASLLLQYRRDRA